MISMTDALIIDAHLTDTLLALIEHAQPDADDPADLPLILSSDMIESSAMMPLPCDLDPDTIHALIIARCADYFDCDPSLIASEY